MDQYHPREDQSYTNTNLSGRCKDRPPQHKASNKPHSQTGAATNDADSDGGMVFVHRSDSSTTLTETTEGFLMLSKKSSVTSVIGSSRGESEEKAKLTASAQEQHTKHGPTSGLTKVNLHINLCELPYVAGDMKQWALGAAHFYSHVSASSSAAGSGDNSRASGRSATRSTSIMSGRGGGPLQVVPPRFVNMPHDIAHAGALFEDVACSPWMLEGIRV